MHSDNEKGKDFICVCVTLNPNTLPYKYRSNTSAVCALPMPPNQCFLSSHNQKRGVSLTKSLRFPGKHNKVSRFYLVETLL